MLNEEFMIGVVRIVPDRNLVISGDNRISLEPRVMDVLCLMAASAKDVISREDFISSIWKVEFGGDESLTRAISILRKTLKTAGVDSVIETIPKRGYRLNTHIHTGAQLEHGEQLESAVRPSIESPIKTESPKNESPPATINNSVEPSNRPSVIPTTDPPLESPSPLAPLRSQSQKTAPGNRYIISILVMAAGFLGAWLIVDRFVTSEPPVNIDQGPLIESSGSDLGQVSLNQQTENETQAKLAMAIIFTHLDGLIELDETLISARRHVNLSKTDFPDMSATRIADGWIQYLDGEPNRALLLFETVIADDPLQSEAWLGKAYIFADQEQYDLAELNVDQAISLNAFSKHPRVAKALFNFRAGKLELAKENAYDVLSYDPRNKIAKDLLDQISKK